MTSYLVSNLGTLPGGLQSAASGINAAGDIAGYAETATGHRHAVLFHHGVPTDLGTLAGPDANSIGVAINNAGDIAGWSNEPGGGFANHAFLYRNGLMTDLGTLGGPASLAYDINAAGDVVGAAMTAAGDIHAFLYTGGQMRDLGTLGGESRAYGINDSGQIVGESNGQAFLSDGQQMQAIGALTHARDINASGRVAGRANQRAALYDASSGVRDLGTLGGQTSIAYGLNDAGEVFGSADVSATVLNAPFTWNPADGIANPNYLGAHSTGWDLGDCNDINGRGQIVGNMVPNNAQFPILAFLITPVFVDPPFLRNIEELLNIVMRFLTKKSVPHDRPIPGDPPLERQLEQEILLAATLNELAAQIGDKEARRAIQEPALDLVIRSARELDNARVTAAKFAEPMRPGDANSFGAFGRLDDPRHFTPQRGK